MDVHSGGIDRSTAAIANWAPAVADRPAAAAAGRKRKDAGRSRTTVSSKSTATAAKGRCSAVATGRLVPGKRASLDFQAALAFNIDSATGSQPTASSTTAVSSMNVEIPDVDVQER